MDDNGRGRMGSVAEICIELSQREKISSENKTREENRKGRRKRNGMGAGGWGGRNARTPDDKLVESVVSVTSVALCLLFVSSRLAVTDVGPFVSKHSARQNVVIILITPL